MATCEEALQVCGRYSASGKQWDRVLLGNLDAAA